MDFGVQSPMGGFNENMGVPPMFDSPNPFMGASSPFMSKDDMFGAGDKPIDIDELVKNIDAQIAKLEKEEEEERKRQEAQKREVQNPIPNPSSLETFDYNNVEIPQIKVENPVPSFTPENIERKISVDDTSVVLDNNVVTDDQFFDDFFGDE